MNLETYIAAAWDQGASDLHMEPGLPVAMRIRGTLRMTGESVPARDLLVLAQEVIGTEDWPRFLERRSYDSSRTIRGVRCRINVLQTSRGVGFAIRLLASFQATVAKLNLHPDFKRFILPDTGLILVSGPTGCGKSSTLAALIQEINLTDARHILTIESPIEYSFRPERAYIRQREVGRDTPSFEQALIDALREDPDVLMVGEMRDAETMRLTLNIAETGHLVLATVHSATCIEALQRIVAAFPAESQNAVAAQLADCLVAVVAQRLHYRQDLGIRVPECEVLVPTNPVKAHIRNRDFFKISSVMETGADAGMWTFPRYRNWLEKRTTWHIPRNEAPGAEAESGEPIKSTALPALAKPAPKASEAATASGSSRRSIEIEPDEGEFGKILK